MKFYNFTKHTVLPLKLSLYQTIYTWRTTCVSASMRVHIPAPHTHWPPRTACMCNYHAQF